MSRRLTAEEYTIGPPPVSIHHIIRYGRRLGEKVLSKSDGKIGPEYYNRYARYFDKVTTIDFNDTIIIIIVLLLVYKPRVQ